jgi:hypothetical protein
MFAPLLVVSGVHATAASPEYCTIYAHASADPEGAAAASAADTEALQRAYDKAYYECLNLDDEPKMPAGFADRGIDAGTLAEGDISGDDESPVVSEPPARPKKTAQAEKPRTKTKWRGSGYDPWTPEWNKWCEEHYKSFDPKTGQYLSYEGEKKMCK